MAGRSDSPALNLKAKGDLAELMVAADLRRRGFKIAIPFGEDCDFDLILIREDRLERVQVKYAESDGACSPSMTAPLPAASTSRRASWAMAAPSSIFDSSRP